MIYALQSPIKCLYCSFYFFTEFFEENFTEVLIELTQQKFVLMKTSWRRLSSSSSEDILKTSSRRLDQDEYVRLSLTSSEDVFKTSWSRPIYSPWPYIFKTSSRSFQDVFKTSCQYVLKTFSRRLPYVLQKRLQNIFKTSSRHFAKISSRRLQDVSS